MTTQVPPSALLPLNPEQLARLQAATTDLTPTQLAWVSGYFWGVLNQQPAALAATPAPAAEMPGITIISASQTGNARRVAEALRDDLLAAKLNVKLVNAGDYKFKQIASEKLLIVVTSTQGEGEPPEEAVALHKFLFSKKAPKLDNTAFAVFGLGAIGLAVVQGARQAKAGRIIAIDTNPKKFDLARRFGATDCINPNDYDKPIKDVLLDINKWGIDHTFECIGNVNVMRAALESAHRGWGQSIVIGVAGAGQEISTRPFQLVTGRVWKGSAFGGVKGRTQLPAMVEDAMKGEIELEPFVTHTMTLDEINEAFDLMHEGKSIRTVIRY